MPIHGRILASAALCASLALTGCLTVNSQSGDGSMPPDLRSSADLRRPTVGQPDVAATQPGYFSSVGQMLDAPYRRYFGTTYSQMTADVGRDRSANLRRSRVLELSTSYAAREPGVLRLFRDVGQYDTDPLVRAAAIRALNVTRDTASRDVLITALKDGHPAVRLEAVKALANLPAAGVDAQLRAIATDANADVDLRIAALDALRHYRSIDNARALIDQLDGGNFGLAWQARRSLYLMTGKDYRYSKGDWLGYISGPDRPVG